MLLWLARKSSLCVMETWTGVQGQLDPSWTGITSIAASMSAAAFVIAGGPHIDTTYEWFPTKLQQSSGKNSRDVTAINTDFSLPRGVSITL